MGERHDTEKPFFASPAEELAYVEQQMERANEEMIQRQLLKNPPSTGTPLVDLMYQTNKADEVVSYLADTAEDPKIREIAKIIAPGLRYTKVRPETEVENYAGVYRYKPYAKYSSDNPRLYQEPTVLENLIKINLPMIKLRTLIEQDRVPTSGTMRDAIKKVLPDDKVYKKELENTLLHEALHGFFDNNLGDWDFTSIARALRSPRVVAGETKPREGMSRSRAFEIATDVRRASLLAANVIHGLYKKAEKKGPAELKKFTEKTGIDDTVLNRINTASHAFIYSLIDPKIRKILSKEKIKVRLNSRDGDLDRYLQEYSTKRRPFPFSETSYERELKEQANKGGKAEVPFLDFVDVIAQPLLKSTLFEAQAKVPLPPRKPPMPQQYNKGGSVYNKGIGRLVYKLQDGGPPPDDPNRRRNLPTVQDRKRLQRPKIDFGSILKTGGRVLTRLNPLFDLLQSKQLADATLKKEIVPKAELPAFFRAYHGSRYDFDKFDMSKEGTGTGVQAYGRGLYLAEQEPTAQYYRGATTTERNPDFEEYLSKEYEKAEQTGNYGRMEMLESAMLYDTPTDFRNKSVDTDYDEDYRKMASDFAEEIESFRDSKGDKVNYGKIYEVDVQTPADTLLDYDKRLSEQSDFVKKAIGGNPLKDKYEIIEESDPYGTYQKFGFADKETGDIDEDSYKPFFDTRKEAEEFLNDPTGDIIYEEIAGDIRYPSYVEGDKSIKDFLEKGIKGIKFEFPDPRTGKQTPNFVIFDDALLDIKRKYKQGGSVYKQGIGRLVYKLQDGGSPPEDPNKRRNLPSVIKKTGSFLGKAGKVLSPISTILDVLEPTKVADATLKEENIANDNKRETRTPGELRTARQYKMGFDDLDFYHGTLQGDIEAFEGPESPRLENMLNKPQTFLDLKQKRYSQTGYHGPGIYMTTDPEEASEQYANPQGDDVVLKREEIKDIVLREMGAEPAQGTKGLKAEDRFPTASENLMRLANRKADELMGTSPTVFRLKTRPNNVVTVHGPRVSNELAQQFPETTLRRQNLKNSIGIALRDISQELRYTENKGKFNFQSVLDKIMNEIDLFVEEENGSEVVSSGDVEEVLRTLDEPFVFPEQLVQNVYTIMGYDAVDLVEPSFKLNENKPVVHRVIFDPEKVRSAFAKFDPLKKDEPGLSMKKGGIVPRGTRPTVFATGIPTALRKGM